MDEVFKKIQIINKILISNISSIENIGLLRGKLGISIYFFHLAKITDEEQHYQIAEQVLKNIYAQASKKYVPLNFESGLAGVAWGIEYLRNNEFVEGNVDKVLSGIDDKIYCFLVKENDIPIGIKRGYLGYLAYILSRLSGRERNGKDIEYFIFRRTLIDILNNISSFLDRDEMIFRPSAGFDILWELPLSLILLSKARGLGLYDYKIDKILDSIIPTILSIVPNSNGNKLYILLGIESILKVITIPKLKAHANIIKNNIKRDFMLSELENKNLYFRNGVMGSYFVASKLYELTKDKKFLFNEKNIIKRIVNSEFWDDVDEEYSDQRFMGITLLGLTGIGLPLLKLYTNPK